MKGRNPALQEAGELAVRTMEGTHLKTVATLTAGSSFGEMSLMYGMARTSTVVARTNCVLWAMPVDDFARFTKEFSRRRRKMESLLAEVPLLSQHITEAERAFLADRMGEEEFRPGETIVRQGADGDKFYLVESGRAVAFVRPTGQRVRMVAEYKRGEFFGELALLQPVTRQATVVSRDITRCVVLDRATFDQIIRGAARRAMEEHAGAMFQRELDGARLTPKRVVVRDGTPGGSVREKMVRLGGPQDPGATPSPSWSAGGGRSAAGKGKGGVEAWEWEGGDGGAEEGNEEDPFDPESDTFALPLQRKPRRRRRGEEDEAPPGMPPMGEAAFVLVVSSLLFVLLSRIR